MPTLALTNFNIVCTVLGGFITLLSLVSYLAKEKLFLSEALISLVAGIIFSHSTKLIKPLEFASGSQASLDAITLNFSRNVLGIQLLIAGIQLPSRYLQYEWKSLTLLLAPGMIGMWTISAALIYAFVPHLPFLHALAIAACVTPTDPVLSNSIVKGKFADKNIPRDLQKIIIAESGANDGLGYPFLFFALYLIKYLGPGQEGNAGTAIGVWFYETWVYTILLSVIYGFTVGWIAKELLHWAEERNFVDRESFLVFAITLALFVSGSCGLLGTDDVLACFIAGNAFTWDDWFRIQTEDDSLQPTIDMLLGIAIFMWYGAVCPWSSFINNDIIPIYRLIPLGILILLLRRLPVVFALHSYIHQIEEKQQAIYAGFFGPIGVSAIFYIFTSLEFLQSLETDGIQRDDVKRLGETLSIVVWFLAICSLVVHGLTIPLGKLGFYIPRTLSRALSSQANAETPPFQIQDPIRTSTNGGLRERRRRGEPSRRSTPDAAPPPPVFRIGGRLVRDVDADAITLAERSRPRTPPAAAIDRTLISPDELLPMPSSYVRQAASEASHKDIAVSEGTLGVTDIS
ncbi:MAG: hypothetical protein M1818_004005 [Claussenomyces sp. TS43310]|nr:MAG: hypothetical protein M1818_004005 [Claussenomyces sp. TS43310]